MKIAMNLFALAEYSYYDSYSSDAVAGISAVTTIIYLVLSILILAAFWMLFSKAGEPGWFSIIPILNVYTLFKIVYGNGWKCLLLFVPILNVVLSIALYIRMAQAYGKGVGFGILSLFFTPIALPILAFGNSSYQGPVYSFI